METASPWGDFEVLQCRQAALEFVLEGLFSRQHPRQIPLALTGSAGLAVNGGKDL